MKRAERHLLEELYAYMTNLESIAADTLLDEEPELKQRRAATKQVRPCSTTWANSHLLDNIDILCGDQRAPGQLEPHKQEFPADTA